MKSMVAIFMAATSLAFAADPVNSAEIIRLGSIEIENPWARASIGTSRPAAAYLTIRNLGINSDRLIEIQSPVAERAEVHATKMDQGIMRMQPAGEILIEPGDVLKFAPGGSHIMLMKLDSQLKKGQATRLTLTFEHAGQIEFNVPILGPGASGPEQ